MRTSRASAKATASSLASRHAFRLDPRPPFRLDLTAWALRRGPQNTIDAWDGYTYRRALHVAEQVVVVAVTQVGPADAPHLEVTVSAGRLGPATVSLVTAQLTRLLGLQIDLAGFYARAASDRVLGPLAQRYRGLKPPRFPTLFECLLNAVACQQLSLAAGLTLLNRLAQAAAPPAGTLHPFPAPDEVTRLPRTALREVGFSTRKADTLRELAEAAADGRLELDRFEPLDDMAVVQALVRWRGIGPWSADYALLRGLGRLHVFPTADSGALGGLRRFLEAAGVDDDPARALARWKADAGMLYFHLLLRGLEQRGALNPTCADHVRRPAAPARRTARRPPAPSATTRSARLADADHGTRDPR